MSSRFSIKKREAWLWSTGHTRQQIERKAAHGKIDGNWLVCPHGDAERSISLPEFLAQPEAFGCSPPTANGPSAVPPETQGSFPLLAICTAVFCMLISIASAGWYFVILLWGLAYLTVCVVHVILHNIASKRPGRLIGFRVASHVTLLLTFLLLRDDGDLRGWIAYKVVLFGESRGSSGAEAPLWLPAWVVLLPFLAYIGTTSWLFLAKRRDK